MSDEEILLEKWRTSTPENSKLHYDYSVEGQIVRLSITRMLNEFDPGKTIYKECPLQIDSIKATIIELSENGDLII